MGPGRHYKKLVPIFEHHKIKLEKFLKRFWIYYRKLKRYKKNPTKIIKKQLDAEFDRLFGTTTGYAEFDERICLTRNKKKHLLVVLDFPEVPLHNNSALCSGFHNPQDSAKSFVERTKFRFTA